MDTTGDWNRHLIKAGDSRFLEALRLRGDLQLFFNINVITLLAVRLHGARCVCASHIFSCVFDAGLGFLRLPIAVEELLVPFCSGFRVVEVITAIGNPVSETILVFVIVRIFPGLFVIPNGLGIVLVVIIVIAHQHGCLAILAALGVVEDLFEIGAAFVVILCEGVTFGQIQQGGVIIRLYLQCL